MAHDIPVTHESARVLVVDDEPMLADLLAEWVDEKWLCETATGGADARARVDDTFDVVLLDRQMPEVPGRAVLESIRDRGLDVQVMFVSSVEPDVDLVALPVDDYLRKPVDRAGLQAKVEGLLLRRTYRAPIQRFFVCAAKLDAIESAKTATALAGNERYLSLRARADELRQTADATLGRRTELVDGLNAYQADD